MLCNLKLASKSSRYCVVFMVLLCKVAGFFLSPGEDGMNLASVVKRQLNYCCSTLQIEQRWKHNLDYNPGSPRSVLPWEGRKSSLWAPSSCLSFLCGLFASRKEKVPGSLCRGGAACRGQGCWDREVFLLCRVRRVMGRPIDGGWRDVNAQS